jgi:hypothetical protein
LIAVRSIDPWFGLQSWTLRSLIHGKKKARQDALPTIKRGALLQYGN